MKVKSKKISNDQIIKFFENLVNSRTERDKDRIKNQIFNGSTFLVYKEAKKYKKFENYEDVLQEGFFGLWKAIRVFDYTKFPNFFVYARQWIKNAIQKSASRFDVVYDPEHRNRTIYGLTDNPRFDNCEESLEEKIMTRERCENIRNEMREFGKDGRMTIEVLGINKGGKEKTLRKVGCKYGLSHERVRQIKNHVIKKIRNRDL